MTAVVLLNASYEPLMKVSFQKAVRMLFREVAIVEEAESHPTGETKMVGPHPWPRVIRLVRYVATKWLYRPAGWSKRGVLVRDGHTCAYCGGHATTVDHLVPLSRGGPWSWENCISACRACNGRKADRTPDEAGMRLRFHPYVPTQAQLRSMEVGR